MRNSFLSYHMIVFFKEYEEYLDGGGVKNLEAVLEEYFTENERLLSEFHHSFMLSIDRKHLSEKYKEQFEDFKIEANYKMTNFIDFSYNIKLADEKIRNFWNASRLKNTSIEE